MKTEKGTRLFHRLDRWVGIPIVLMLSLFKRKFKKLPLPESPAFAILNLVSIGDNVVMSAVINDIRCQYPKSLITAFTGSTNYEIVKLIPGFNNIVKLPVTNMMASYKLIKKSGHFDVLIDFGSWPRLNAIYSFFFKAHQKIGFKTPKQFRHFVYDIKINYSSEIHEINNFRNLISGFYTGEPHNQSLSIIPTNNSRNLIKTLGNYCIIHPWPSGYKSYMKEWPTNYWIDLVTKIDTYFDNIVITGASANNEQSEKLFILAKKNNRVSLVNLSGTINIQELVHLISASELVISVNTGVAHIAAALDKKQICLHGPTNILRWGPVSKNTISIKPSTGTFGYLNFGFEYHKANGSCMENISVTSVYNIIKDLQSKRGDLNYKYSHVIENK